MVFGIPTTSYKKDTTKNPLKNSISFHAESIFKIKNINKSNNYKNLILDIKRFFIGFSRRRSPDKVKPFCFD